jgi:spore coat protein U-like protein
MTDCDRVTPDFCLEMKLAAGSDIAGRLLFVGLIVSLLLPVFANASCRFTSISDISFGNYNVFSPLPNSGGVGSLTISCGSGEHSPYDVTLSVGQSNSYATRFMRNGANKLNYNLYTNASRTIIWGNGSGGSSALTVSRSSTSTLTIYGLIPEGQDVTFGTYTDFITASVNF